MGIFGRFFDKFGIIYFVDIDEYVNAIKERAGEFLAIALDLLVGAGALVRMVT